jgi:hypothetical protein
MNIADAFLFRASQRSGPLFNASAGIVPPQGPICGLAAADSTPLVSPRQQGLLGWADAKQRVYFASFSGFPANAIT